MATPRVSAAALPPVIVVSVPEEDDGKPRSLRAALSVVFFGEKWSSMSSKDNRHLLNCGKKIYSERLKREGVSRRSKMAKDASLTILLMFSFVFDIADIVMESNKRPYHYVAITVATMEVILFFYGMAKAYLYPRWILYKRRRQTEDASHSSPSPASASASSISEQLAETLVDEALVFTVTILSLYGLVVEQFYTGTSDKAIVSFCLFLWSFLEQLANRALQLHLLFKIAQLEKRKRTLCCDGSFGLRRRFATYTMGNMFVLFLYYGTLAIRIASDNQGKNDYSVTRGTAFLIFFAILHPLINVAMFFIVHFHDNYKSLCLDMLKDIAERSEDPEELDAGEVESEVERGSLHQVSLEQTTEKDSVDGISPPVGERAKALQRERLDEISKRFAGLRRALGRITVDELLHKIRELGRVLQTGNTEEIRQKDSELKGALARSSAVDAQTRTAVLRSLEGASVDEIAEKVGILKRLLEKTTTSREVSPAVSPAVAEVKKALEGRKIDEFSARWTRMRWWDRFRSGVTSLVTFVLLMVWGTLHVTALGLLLQSTLQTPVDGAREASLALLVTWLVFWILVNSHAFALFVIVLLLVAVYLVATTVVVFINAIHRCCKLAQTPTPSNSAPCIPWNRLVQLACCFMLLCLERNEKPPTPPPTPTPMDSSPRSRPVESEMALESVE